MPKVSVLVPVYNVDKYLEKCLNSILNQTYDNIEIILVDDGSKDDSGKICDIYKEKDNRIKVIHKENGGVSSARNCGIDAAKGKNIFFFEKYKNNLVKRGTIITDNLSFHGLVEDSDLVKTKNQKGIVNKIKDFISFLDNNDEFDTEYIPVGDKIAISKRRSDYE